jgi:hypothetical protein
VQIPIIIFAAEFEQAVTAAEVLDQASEPGAPWGYNAMTAVVERYGHAGEDLPFEYQNEIYSVFENGRAPVGVLFH